MLGSKTGLNDIVSRFVCLFSERWECSFTKHDCYSRLVLELVGREAWEVVVLEGPGDGT